MDANVFVVTSGKGGVGKTTTTANIGAALAKLGKQVVLVDADIGLRNLDLVLGLEKRIVYDVVDVIEGRCQPRQALIKDKRIAGLYLLPAAQTKEKESVSESQMEHMTHALAGQFDAVLIDCPAGIEHGFRNAIAGASQAVVVTMPEVAAIRDADRILGMLGSRRARVLINRIRPEMVKSGDMLSVDDVREILGREILGIVPDDEEIIDATNRGQPVVLDGARRLGAVYSTIGRRLLGEDIPYVELPNDGLWLQLRKMMAGLR
ncbi:MAG: septum site-determining protein MinD [Candidatus Eremiobacter antarcticus]|nr:septum site-determining protein MinD [Candidatus Eremiobacteraeota bacterium]MBC5808142.1 septum site-determining protein MinD [Candidatus Eremiobacteraeota bacterium]PZR63538.1 MAG: septum site-determining protein MinD [Candidatus Eremiobacter sp. RRmetagenome_bin22]